MSVCASYPQPTILGSSTPRCWRFFVGMGRACLAAMCICVLFILAQTGLSATDEALAAAPSTKSRPKPKQARTKIDSYTIAQRGDHYRVNITYPQLGIPAADAEISIWAREQATTFIESVQQIPRPMPMPYELTITYETITPSRHATSVVFTISTFMSEVHPEPGLATFVYARPDGVRLTYGDLFLRMDGILESFSSLCRASLTEKLGNGLDRKMLELGTKPRMSNFDLFALTDTGVRIFFPPYQVAPLKDGYLHVDIPLTNLMDYKPRMRFWGKR